MKKIFLLFLVLLGCSSKSPSKPVILVMIPSYAFFVEQIVGDEASIEIFVPPGANPHTYEPNPKQVERFANAKVWFRYGDAIEEKILPFLREKHVTIVDLSKGISLLSSHEEACGETHDHEGKDRHLWLDPRLALLQTRKIVDTLNQLWPEKKELFEDRFQFFSLKLKSLDTELETQLKPYKGSYLLLSHPALGYFCHRYSLHQLSIECEGKEPRPQQVGEIFREAQDHKIPVVFIEPQYNNKGAQLIAEKLQIPTYQINPYAFDYFGTMHDITNGIINFYGHQS